MIDKGGGAKQNNCRGILYFVVETELVVHTFDQNCQRDVSLPVSLPVLVDFVEDLNGLFHG